MILSDIFRVNSVRNAYFGKHNYWWIFKKRTFLHRARLDTVSRPILNENWLNSPSFKAIESGVLRLLITWQGHVTKIPTSPPNSVGKKYPMKSLNRFHGSFWNLTIPTEFTQDIFWKMIIYRITQHEIIVRIWKSWKNSRTRKSRKKL